MKHILLIANDSTYVYNLRKEIIKALIQNGHCVTVICEKKQYIEELKALGCKIWYITVERHSKNPLKDLQLLKIFKMAILELHPDVVLTYNIKPNVYAGMICKQQMIPYITNICGLGTPVEDPGILQKITCLLYKIGISKASCVFFQNNANLDFFRSHKLLRTNTHTVLLPGSGVNLEAHPLLPYPESNERIHFLYIARLMKEKGIDILLGAAKTIHTKYPNTIFHICGGCDDVHYLEIVKQAEKLGYVFYHGEQKDVTPFFAMAHCYVYPSYYPEGLSNVLLEAAASGRPSISTDRPGCREVIDDGVTGFIVPIKNELAVVNAIEKFLHMSPSTRLAMGKAGRKKAEREFDRQLVVNAYLEEIENTIQKRDTSVD